MSSESIKCFIENCLKFKNGKINIRECTETLELVSNVLTSSNKDEHLSFYMNKRPVICKIQRLPDFSEKVFYVR